MVFQGWERHSLNSVRLNRIGTEPEMFKTSKQPRQIETLIIDWWNDPLTWQRCKTTTHRSKRETLNQNVDFVHLNKHFSPRGVDLRHISRIGHACACIMNEYLVESAKRKAHWSSKDPTWHSQTLSHLLESDPSLPAFWGFKSLLIHWPLWLHPPTSASPGYVYVYCMSVHMFIFRNPLE